MTQRAKVTILGAGQTGGTMAHLLARLGLVDVVLYDVLEGFPQGKALDLLQACAVLGSDAKIIGANVIGDAAGSDVVIITAGSPRKPGQSREELAAATAAVVRDLVPKVARVSPDAIFIGFTNPMDAMTQIAMESAQLPRHRIVGQGGMLDTARFKTFIARELGVSTKRVDAIVLGGHTEKDMVPIVSRAKVGGVPLIKVLSQARIQAIVERTKNGGAEILGLMKTGSAFFAPAEATVAMVKAILMDQKRVMPASAYCQGEYGVCGMFVGVPVRLGRSGVEKIVRMRLDAAEKEALWRAAVSTRELVERIR